VASRHGARYPTASQLRAAAVRELCLYVTHGLLHLSGYDDHEPRASARMHRREDALLRRFGIGAVYADDAPR
jgi:probable rRNA maturation factor